nr:hypothetical protein GCM10020063_009710 [Dactylosporangium thailandense]
MVADVAPTAQPATDLRRHLTDELTAEGAITTEAVTRAVLSVPRELFAPPGTDMAAVYAAHGVLVTKRGADGQAMSSVTAPWLQTRMIEQARIGPGSRVLEIGSGGYNAALIAEIVGPDGCVTSIDIDADVIDRARAGLAATGHPVTVAVTDGANGYPTHAPYDAIIVTVEAADIPPAWIDQLAPGGVLVVPLRMRGNTRSIAFTRRGDHLAATSMILCGFVPMQGDDAQPEQHLPLGDDTIVLRLDDPTTRVDPAALTAALTGPRLEAWAPVTMPPRTSFETLLLWLASQPVPYGRLILDRDRTADRIAAFAAIIPAFLTADSLAYLALRRLDEHTWQFGGHGFGPDADRVTEQLLDAIAVWNRAHRHGPDPQITVHPAGTTQPATAPGQFVLPRRHTTIALTWPGTGAAA